MGVDCYATTVIGVSVDTKHFYKDIKERSCNHEIDAAFNFCPECGKPLYKTKTVIIDEVRHDKIGKFKICYSTDNYYAVIGVSGQTLNIMESSDLIKLKVDIDNIVNIRNELKEVLEPLGWWNENNFGIWTVGYCSY